MGSGFLLESPGDVSTKQKAAKSALPDFMQVGWSRMGIGLPVALPLRSGEKGKKKKGDLATSGLDCSLNLDLIPFSLYKPLIESTSGSSLGFTASYLLPLYPFLFLRSSFWTFSFWTSFLVSAFPSLNYLREQPWQCMVIMSLACHIYLTSDIGIQRSCPRGHTGANSRRLASTMPSWMWQRGCGQPGMLGCRTTSWPLESCHSPCMNWSTSVARCLGFSLIHWECSTATRFRV